MKIYWNYNSIPEVKDLSKEDRKKAWAYAYKKCFRHWQTYLGLIICGFCAGFGSFISGGSVFGAGIGGGVGGFIFGQIATVVARDYLAEWKAGNLEGDNNEISEPVG